MKRLKSVPIIFLLFLLSCLISFSSCSYDKQKDNQSELNKDEQNSTYDTNVSGAGNSDTTVENCLEQMTLDEKIYQMFFVTPESLTGVGQVITAGKTTQEALVRYPVGGIIYFSTNLQDRKQIINMTHKSQEFSKIPLFIGVDEEGGRVTRLGNNSSTGVTQFSSMQSVGETHDPTQAYAVGETIGKEISDLGFNVDFAPVADVLINSNNTEIGDRSFGSDPVEVSEMVKNEVIGLQNNNISAILKHFPGHGSTVTNSHINYSESQRTIDELRNCEFLPFKAGIDAKADFVLLSHATYVNVVDEKCPASLSKEIVTDYLLNELGFQGIVITDSFSMGAITNNYTTEVAAVKAVNAGVDMILMPNSISEAFSGIKNAVLSGELSEERIDKSVLKILKVKHKHGMLKN